MKRNSHAIGNTYATKEIKAEAVLNIRCTTEQKNKFVKAAKRGKLSNFIIETIEKRVTTINLQDKLNAALTIAKAAYIEINGADCNVSQIGLRHFVENDAWEVEILENNVDNTTRYFSVSDTVRIFERGFTEYDANTVLLSLEVD